MINTEQDKSDRTTVTGRIRIQKNKEEDSDSNPHIKIERNKQDSSPKKIRKRIRIRILSSKLGRICDSNPNSESGFVHIFHQFSNLFIFWEFFQPWYVFPIISEVLKHFRICLRHYMCRYWRKRGTVNLWGVRIGRISGEIVKKNFFDNFLFDKNRYRLHLFWKLNPTMAGEQF